MRKIIVPALLLLWSTLCSPGCSSLPVDDPDTLHVLVRELAGKGREDRAWKLAAEGHRRWPAHPALTRTWVDLSLDRATGDDRYDYILLDQVEAECLQAVAGGGVEQWYTLGLVRQRRGDLEGAVRAWREGLRREAYHVKTLSALAALHYSLGRESQAGRLYAELVRIPPPRAEVYYRLAVCRLSEVERRHKVGAEDFAEAEVEGLLRRALKAAPGHAPSLRCLAWLTVRLSELSGRWSDAELRGEDAIRARELLRRALKASPSDAESLHDLGWLAQEEGRETAAESLYCKSLEADPDCVPSLLDLAALLSARGGHEEEVKALRRRAERHTDDPFLRRSLRRYRTRKATTKP